MDDIPYQKIIHAAGMGLTRSQAMELLDITPHHLRKAIDKYGITFVSGYNKPKEDKPQKKPEVKVSSDPYFSSSKDERLKVYKNLVSKAKTPLEKAEITYGYCLYEFEFAAYKAKNRTAFPCRMLTNGLSKQERGAMYNERRRAEKVEDILSIVKRLGAGTSANVSEFTDISQKSVTTYMQRMFLDGLLERTMLVSGKNRTRSWIYTIKPNGETPHEKV